VQNPTLKYWVEAYAQDQDLFFRNYAKAHVRLSELGQEDHLMSEVFDDAHMIDGGYVESSTTTERFKYWRTYISAYISRVDQKVYLDAEKEPEK
jgi:hypothetical protein